MTRISWPILLVAALSSGVAWGGSYEDAQAELAAAYNSYYKELRKKPKFSEDDAKKLAGEILAPANAKVAKAMEDDSRRTALSRESDSPASSAYVTPPSVRAPAGVPMAPLEEVVIDGGDIPKEIEFPGKKRK